MDATDLVRMGLTAEVDVEQRILRGARVGTSNLADDGWIVLAQGMDLTVFRANPNVLEAHAPPAVGRALAMHKLGGDLVADVQFADTARGREYAYLYGVNAERTAFMRGWSIRADILEREVLTVREARRMPVLVPEDVAERIESGGGKVAVARRSLLREFSVVAVPADRTALTRAYANGVELAAEIMAKLDLASVRETLATVARQCNEMREQVRDLRERMLALERDGASAAIKGDTEDLLKELDRLNAMLRDQRN